MNYTMKPLKLTPVVPLGRISKAKRSSISQRKTKALTTEEGVLRRPLPPPSHLVHSSLKPAPTITTTTGAPSAVPTSTFKPKFARVSAPSNPSKPTRSRIVKPGRKHHRLPTRPGSLTTGLYGAVPRPQVERVKQKAKGKVKQKSKQKKVVPKAAKTKPAVKAFQVEGYTFGDTLGQGTFGKVDKAEHLMTGVSVAMKILEKARITEIADVNRVTREIRILKRVCHPNVVRLFNVIDTLEHICLVTEFLDGGELFDYIVEKKRIAEPEACDLFIQIMNGLDYIHHHNIIHRDLKPENLLLKKGPNGKRIIKIADFGLSNTNEGGRKLSTACGSPCYAAPEMIQGMKYDGTKSDIWSIGVVLYAMVCGYLPFEDNDTSLLYKKILAASYEEPRFLSARVSALLAAILTVDPEKRYDSVAIRKHPWCTTYIGETAYQPEPDVLALDVDPSLAAKLNLQGMDIDKLRESLAAKKFNSYTAAYYLLQSTVVDDRAKGTADASISSDVFDQVMHADSSHSLVEAPAATGPELFPGILVKQMEPKPTTTCQQAVTQTSDAAAAVVSSQQDSA